MGWRDFGGGTLPDVCVHAGVGRVGVDAMSEDIYIRAMELIFVIVVGCWIYAKVANWFYNGGVWE